MGQEMIHALAEWLYDSFMTWFLVALALCLMHQLDRTPVVFPARTEITNPRSG